jgi:hypothetical protein
MGCRYSAYMRTAYRHTGILRTINYVHRTQITCNELRYWHAVSPVFYIHVCVHAKCNMVKSSSATHLVARKS